MTLLKNKEEEETSKSHRQIGEKKIIEKKIRLFSPGRAEVINFKIKNKKRIAGRGQPPPPPPQLIFIFLTGEGGIRYRYIISSLSLSFLPSQNKLKKNIF